MIQTPIVDNLWFPIMGSEVRRFFRNFPLEGTFFAVNGLLIFLSINGKLKGNKRKLTFN